MLKEAHKIFIEKANQGLEKYRPYNSFYKRPDVRRIIASLYGNKCAITGEDIDFADGEVGHIVPRSRPDLFEPLFPGLDADNIINLHWIKKSLNRRNSATANPSPLSVHAAIAFSAGLVDRKLNSVMQATTELDLDALEASLGKDIVLDVSPVYAVAIDFNGYHAIPLDSLEALITSRSYSETIIDKLFETYLEVPRIADYQKQRLYNPHPSCLAGEFYDGDEWVDLIARDFKMHDKWREENLPEGRWLLLKGNSSDAPKLLRYREYTTNELYVRRTINTLRFCRQILSQGGHFTFFESDHEGKDACDKNLGTWASEFIGVSGYVYFDKGKVNHHEGPLLNDCKNSAVFHAARESKKSGTLYRKKDFRTLARACDERLSSQVDFAQLKLIPARENTQSWPSDLAIHV